MITRQSFLPPVKFSYRQASHFFTPFETPFTTDTVQQTCTRLPKNCLNLYGLKFVFDNEKLHYKLLPLRYSIESLLQISTSIIDSFREINKTGYITPQNLTHPMFALIKKNLKAQGIKTSLNEFGSSLNTYSFWCNYINLSLLLTIHRELKMVRSEFMDDKALDLLCDLESVTKHLTSFLDPYIRIQLQKRGITVFQNLYTGFDTEYELNDARNFLNKLVSVQVAVQTRILIKIPLNTTQDISYVHPLTSEITNLFQPVDLK